MRGPYFLGFPLGWFMPSLHIGETETMMTHVQPDKLFSCSVFLANQPDAGASPQGVVLSKQTQNEQLQPATTNFLPLDHH